MILSKGKIVPSLLLVTSTVFLFGCEGKFKEIQQNNFKEFTPNGEAENIDLKYTDSAKIKLILKSKKMLDFTSVSFPFTEFPKGIILTLYDDKAKTIIITSKYAVSYKKTSIIDLQGNVKIVSQDGQVFETEQLYYDQKNEWFYTERKYKFSDLKGNSVGQGIDFSKDFKTINSQRFSGEVLSDD